MKLDPIDKHHASIVLEMVPGAIRRLNARIEERRKYREAWLRGEYKMTEAVQDYEGKWVNKDISGEVIEDIHREIMELSTLRRLARKGAEAMKIEYEVPYMEER